MKSNVCKLEKNLECLNGVQAEVGKACAYNELDKKCTLRLCLLAEELCGMLPGLIKNFDGEF